MVHLHSGVDVRVTGRRIVATIVDGLVLSAAYWVLSRIFHTAYVPDLNFTRLSTGAGLGMLLFALLYYTLLEGEFGRTVGKAVVGIRVIGAGTGRPPGLPRALVRTLLRVID